MMEASSWDESLATGNELIDRQHRELVRLLDVMKESEGGGESEALKALDEVVHQTFVHFHAEEDLMAEVSYPPDLTQTMVDQHRDFKAYLRLRVLEFRTGVQLSILPLQQYLATFLTVHEFGFDRSLADWIRQRGEGRPSQT